MHHYQDLIELFEQIFFADYNTRLVKGEDEPIYLPADEQRSYHALYFAHGFFSSALHECAHWLIAGEERRKQVDFGYWYLPDGRTDQEQKIFQTVEVKPQALEWILSVAAGHRFYISIDNLNGPEGDSEVFKKAVYTQVLHYITHGLPQRAQIFREAICLFYQRSSLLVEEDFQLSAL